MVVTDKGAETRQRILEVAARAFADRGYAGTSLNDVIRQTGLTKGALYFHFDSKVELALAVLDFLRDRSRATALEAAGAHARAADQIDAMVRSIVRQKAEDHSLAALGRICQDLAEAEPQLRGKLGHFEGWFETTERMLRAAQAEGSMDPNVDPATAAWFCVTAFVGADFVSDLRGEALGERVDDYLAFVARAVGLQQ